MNEIVKYHNNLSELPLRRFTAAELDLLMTLCSRCKYHNTDLLTFDFDYLRGLANYKAKDEKQFIKDLCNTNKKLLELNMKLEDETKIVQFVLFTRFLIDKEQRTLEVRVNEEFKYILNELSSNFTRFELAEFVSLKSSYAKACYRQLKRYRDTGFWTVSVERFRELMDIPESYSYSDINKRVLAPIEEELSKVFKNFVIDKEYGSGRGKPLKAYKFFFDEDEKWEPLPDDEPEPKNPAEKNSGFNCPICGQPLVEKVLNDSNCWCHSNGWRENAACKAIFNSIAEIKGYKEPDGSGQEEPEKPKLKIRLLPPEDSNVALDTPKADPDETEKKPTSSLQGIKEKVLNDTSGSMDVGGFFSFFGKKKKK